MKKNLFLSLLFLPLCLHAAPVSPQRASKLAENVLRKGGSPSTTVRLIVEDKATTKSSNANPPYYIFAGNFGGFVMMASDDRLSPVLGWSPAGTFKTEGMPGHVRAWLDMWAGISDAVQEGRLAGMSGASAEWESISSGKGPVYDGPGRLLQTANWDQTAPFNSLCPVYDGKTCVTGCVATATAIVMRYHKWPEYGVGTLPSYTFNDDAGVLRTVGAVNLGHSYSWEDMPLNLGTASPEEQKKAVARLISDIGVMVKSSYNAEGTGAYTTDVYPGLVDHYFYDASAMHYFRAYYNHETWEKMLRDNIDKVGPVLYSGYGEKEGGHAFVLDGYNAQGLFHINWGWGGNNNGYYAIPSFDSFVEGHGATLNLHKDEGGDTAELLYIDGNGKEKGLSCSTETFSSGEPFTVECNYLFNFSSRDFNGEVALAIIHADGSMGEILDLDSLYITSMRGGSFTMADCVIEGEIEIGDRICLWYRSANTPKWTYINACLEDGNIAEIPIADAKSIAEATSFRYTSSSGVLIVSTKKNVQWTLTDSVGVTYEENIVYEDGVLTIDTTRFPKSSYFLTLSKGKDSKTVEFLFGSK